MGKLIYEPDNRSSKGRIELPIRALANPLEGTFDLTRCGDSVNFLSISTGYRKGKKAVNAKKVEIWLAPRFLIERNINGSANHFESIMENWNESTAPVGLFYTWSDCDNMRCFDYVTTLSMEAMSSENCALYGPKHTKEGYRTSFHAPQRAKHLAAQFHFLFDDAVSVPIIAMRRPLKASAATSAEANHMDDESDDPHKSTTVATAQSEDVLMQQYNKLRQHIARSEIVARMEIEEQR